MKNTNIRISGMLFCYCWPCPTIAVQLHYNTKDHSIEWPFFKFAIDLANTILYNCYRLAYATHTIYKEVSKLC